MSEATWEPYLEFAARFEDFPKNHPHLQGLEDKAVNQHMRLDTDHALDPAQIKRRKR